MIDIAVGGILFYIVNMENKDDIKLKVRNNINVACDLLDIPTPYIHYNIPKYMKEQGKEIATTIKKGNHYHIYLNIDYENKSILYNACLHECRHVYQYIVCDSPMAYMIEPKELVDAWRNNLKCYIGNQIENYELQPLELDAYAFGDYVYNTMYGQEMIVRKDFVRRALLKRMMELSDIYTEEEILSIASDYFNIEQKRPLYS